MLTSRDRILTTHVGSLPRNETITELLIKREAGEAIDREDRCRTNSTARSPRWCKRQKDAGIDIGNDGEQQRVAFQTYMAARMTGYGGESKRRVGKDFVEHPDLVATFGRRFVHRAKISNAPQAIADVKYTDMGPIKDEIARFKKHAVRRLRRAVHDRAVARHRRDHADERALRLARGLRDGARDGAREGIPRDPRGRADPAGRCARSRDGTRDDVPGRDRRGLRQDRRDASRGDQQGDCEGIPRDRWRLHVCWGNWEGPHVYDIALVEGAAGVLPDDRRRALDRVRQSAPPARIRGVQEASVPEGQDPDPGRDRVDQRISSSTRKWWRAASRRRSRRSATASASSPRPTAASAPSRGANGSRPRSCGRSSRPCARAPTLHRSGFGARRSPDLL